MIYRHDNLAQVPPPPLGTADWSPWIIGGAILASGLLALIATMKANRR